MKPRSLEERMQSFGGPVKMLRSSTAGSYSFPAVPAQYSSFREEQLAWAQSVLLQDMGQHMPSVVFKGPDVKPLFSALATNSFANFGKNKAKQFLFCRDDGFVIGDGVVVALEDDEYEVMSLPCDTNWLEYHIEKDGYDVTVTHDHTMSHNTDAGRRFYRYQIQGPLALEVLEKALGKPVPDIKFFNVGEFEIAGVKVRALSHTMSRKAGFEMFGPRSEGPQVRAALLEAGRPYGMRESGAMALASNAPEAGWVGSQMPAIYSGAFMKPFREWVSEFGFEGFASLGGSFASDDIEDYYVTPWDIGYGHLIKFDHDFVGREALEKLADVPHRRKVWLKWDDTDVTRLFAESMLGHGPKPRMLGVPMSTYVSMQNDQVLIGDTLVGLSRMCGYTANVGSWFSVASVDPAQAVDGTQVEVLWGDADSSLRELPVEPDVLTRIKAVVHTRPLV